MAGQIKTKERVRHFSEVFTNEREVNAMLDLVVEKCHDISATFLEPACGNGNFLIEIFRRKLQTVSFICNKNNSAFELLSIKAISSIYGVDIQEDNIFEARERLFEYFFAVYVKLFNRQPSTICKAAITYILDKNIQCGNTLTALDNTGKPLIICEWNIEKDFSFTRKDYLFSSMVETGCNSRPIKEYPKANIAWIASLEGSM